MLASWMAYASIVSLTFMLAALALERVASGRWPARWIWAVALLASIVWPIIMATRPALTERSGVIGTPPLTVTLPITVVAASPQSIADQPAERSIGTLVNRALIVGWACVSGLMLLQYARGQLCLRRRRSEWRRDSIEGVQLNVSVNDGPAVVGFAPMEIVVPEWITCLDASLRTVILRHEHEHRVARDPYLLLAGTIAIALFPWNAAFWLIQRRLRLAIEMDCDARVLRVHPSPERYGLLLLAVAQRRSAASMRFATTLSEPTTHLERRIIAMQASRRMARFTSYAVGTGAIALVAIACSLRTAAATPATPVGMASSTILLQSVDPFATWMNKQGFRSWTTARPTVGNRAPRYPDELLRQRVEGTVIAAVVIDTSGIPVMSQFQVVQSTNALFVASVREALPAMRFVSAQVNGEKVRQLIQVPFVFSLGTPGSGVGALPAALDTAYRTNRCTQGECPVYRLRTVVSMARP